MVKDPDLYNEFLDHMAIDVSEFYRNPNGWEVLEKRVLPELLAKNGRIKFGAQPVQQVKSRTAWLLCFSSFLSLREIQVLATDIDQHVVEKAKLGKHSMNALKDVPKWLLNNYLIFTLQ
jgi:chemotaxis protein methyltransferase CheR